MVEKYVSKDCRECFKEDNLSDHARRILRKINNYIGLNRNRSSDKHVRMIFDCLLLYYIETFEHEKISDAIEQIFIWAYSLLVKQKGCREAGMNHHILNNKGYGLGHNPFEIIKKASQASEFTRCTLDCKRDYFKKAKNPLYGIEEIITLLEDMGKLS